MNQTEENKTEQKLAVILVRGLARITQPIKDTLIMLNLTRKIMQWLLKPPLQI